MNKSRVQAIKRRNANKRKIDFRYKASEVMQTAAMEELIKKVEGYSDEEVNSLLSNNFATLDMKEIEAHLKSEDIRKLWTIRPTGNPTFTLLQILSVDGFRWQEVAEALSIALVMGESLKFVRRNLNREGVDRFQEICKKYGVSPTYEKASGYGHLMKFSRFSQCLAFLYPVLANSGVPFPLRHKDFSNWHYTGIALQEVTTLKQACGAVLMHEALQQHYISQRAIDPKALSNAERNDRILDSRQYIVLSLFNWGPKQKTSMKQGVTFTASVKKQRPPEPVEIVLSVLEDVYPPSKWTDSGNLKELIDGLLTGRMSTEMAREFKEFREKETEEIRGDLLD